MEQPTESVISLRRLTVRGLTALALAVGVNLGILSLVRLSSMVATFEPLSVPPVTFLTVLGVIAATAVHGALSRIFPRPDSVFIRLAIIVLFLSFIPDLVVLRFDQEATLGAILVLMSMHIIVAAICVALLTDRYSPIGRAT